MLKAREAVCNLKSYRPPLGSREGLRLDFNENTAGCSPKVLRCLQQLTAEQLAVYPDREPAEAMVASHLGIKPEELLLTNGVDEAIHLLCESYLEPGEEALIVVPTFSLYEIYAAATGAFVRTVPAGADFNFPTAAVLAQITGRTRLVAIASPNNPTGAVAPQADLLEIVRAAPEAAMLVDEAYFDFCGETLLTQWREFPNLFVARTFSKAYGLAGLRIGILAGDAEQVSMIRRVSSPYNVNAVALACLPAALADRAYVRRYVEQVRQGRERLQDALDSWGIQYWPSRANFVLIRLGHLKSAVIEGMKQHGILVRDRSSDYGCEGCVRITLGTAEQTDRLLIALRQVLEEIGTREITSRLMAKG